MEKIPSLMCENLSSPSIGASFDVMLDRTTYTAKPPRGDPAWSRISHELANNRESITIPDLARLLTSGCSFAPGVFRDNKRSNDSWLQQQVFGLDFDESLSIEEFLEMSRGYGITPVFCYPSFSHTNGGHRFRAVFLSDTVITDVRVRTFIITLLFLMYTKPGNTPVEKHGPDPHCRDFARFFLGTNKPLIQQDFTARINPIQLLNAFLSGKRRSDSTNLARWQEKVASECGIEFLRNRGLRVDFFEYVSSNEVTDENTVGVYTLYAPTQNSSDINFSLVRYNDIIYKIHWKETTSSSKKHSNNRRAAGNKKPVEPAGRLDKTAKDVLLVRCRLLKEFITGEEHVHYDERFLLITNLQYKQGGIKWFQEGLKSRDDYTSDALVYEVPLYGYKPASCSRCPYSDVCDHKSNLLQQLPIRRRECRQIKDTPPRMSLAETRIRLSNAIYECMASAENKVFVIKSDTGVGKTELLLRQPLDGVCVAFDTHRLKEEAYRRLNGQGRDVYVWPAPPPLPTDIENKVKRCHALGVGNTTMLYQEALGHPDVVKDGEWQRRISDYLQALRDIHVQSSVFTTHEKAYQLQKNPSLHTFVFDEDFTKTMIRVDQVTLDDIDRIRKMIRGSKDERDRVIDAHLKSIQQAPSRITHYNQPPQYSDGRLHGLLLNAPKSMCSPIEALFACNAYRKDVPTEKSFESVFCITRQSLREDRKYIVLSATADEEVCRMLFGDRLRFIDLSGTELKGKVICHTTPSYSKSYISRDVDGFVETVQKHQGEYGFDGIITHKQYVEEREDEMYLTKTNGAVPVFGTFGGLQGLDGFGGKSIAVFGTPYVPEYVVKLWAAVLGINADEDDYDFEERPVEWNEFEVHVPTCSEDVKLQRIQLWLAYSEIVQAVGRARLVSNDCEVHVFAKIPVSGAELVA